MALECAICLEAVEAVEVGGDACHLRCGHRFHASCLLQSVMHDPRCPICRTELATRPAPPPPQQHVVELTLGDVNTAIEDEVRTLRRHQTNYDARRRRFLRRRPELQREVTDLRRQHGELRDLERRISDHWARETRALWKSPALAELKAQRSLLLRRMRRRERLVDTAVEAVLGERPELSDDDESDETFMRAIAQLGRRRVQQALPQLAHQPPPPPPQIVAAGDEEGPGE